MTIRPPVLLRPPRPDDEAEARCAHDELAREGFEFLQDLRPGEPWSEYLARLHGWPRGLGLPDGWVPSTFLLAEAEGRVVGRVGVRHELNDFLAEYGGHIGYAVRPAFRRRGYAVDMLRQCLELAAKNGIDQVLVTCDLDNDGSAAVIERCGGRFERLAPASASTAVRKRYWVPTRG